MKILRNNECEAPRTHLAGAGQDNCARRRPGRGTGTTNRHGLISPVGPGRAPPAAQGLLPEQEAPQDSLLPPQNPNA